MSVIFKNGRAYGGGSGSVQTQNNLTTTDEGYALDARQGKILSEKIEELLSSINTKSSREEVDKTIESTRREVENIRKLLDEAMEESKQQKTDTLQNSSGGFLGSIFGRK